MAGPIRGSADAGPFLGGPGRDLCAAGEMFARRIRRDDLRGHTETRCWGGFHYGLAKGLLADSDGCATRGVVLNNGVVGLEKSVGFCSFVLWKDCEMGGEGDFLFRESFKII